MSSIDSIPGNTCFVGIAGMGMAPLAIYAKGAGWHVSGCDDGRGAPTLDVLDRAGIDVFFPDGPLPDNTDLLVISSAIGRNHPLRIQADERGIGILRRGEFLAMLAARKKLLAVVGSHGKTTTCGMLIDCLAACGIDFGYVLGGLFADSSVPPACHSHGEWLIAEVDESDGTIEAFNPELTLVVNLDWDHPDRYPDEAAMALAFRRIVERTRGMALLPTGCDGRLFDPSERPPKLRTYGNGGDFLMTPPTAADRGWIAGLDGLFPPRSVTIPVGGSFNVHNACAAMAACAAVTGQLPDHPLERFSGIYRRQELLHCDEQYMVIADYAHHPGEISELLRYLRDSFPGRLRVVFQPHRYSRTRQYAGDFATALQIADEVVLLPVYAAAEQPIEGGESVAIASAMAGAGIPVALCPDPDLLSDYLRPNYTTAREVIAFVGAGDINEFAVEWLNESLGATARRRTLWR